MKGIYLTEQGKAEIQAKIAELESGLKVLSLTEGFKDMGKISIYKEILSSATILAAEESWSDMQILNNDNLEYVKSKFANGVIIQPKQ
jgi:hypothetical protein